MSRLTIDTFHTRLLLALIAVLLGGLIYPPDVLAADDCIVERTTNKSIGKKKKNETYTFQDLSKITGIVKVDVDKNKQCPGKKYGFNDNKLTVYNSDADKTKCKAKFTVKGEKKDCSSGEPVNDDISQKPLFLTQAAEPNVMYILDDSGSMQFELMPDSIIYSSARYIFPRADGVYKGNDYSNYVPTVDANSGFNARSRSPQINSVYYNPGTTYSPWIKADGTLYPDANPSCAFHNPDRPTNSFDAKYCRKLNAEANDNYNSVRWYECNSSGSCSYTTSAKKYWPAKYFWYKGTGSDWSWSNFKEVEIRSGKTYTGDGRDNRDDCDDEDTVTCTYEQEMQNFANWYTYYRSRVLTARGGSGYAFAEQGAGIRVGFGSINQGETTIDGEKTKVIVNGVRTFEGEARKEFYKSLYEREIPNSGTPLRLAVDYAGKYFSRKDNKGPWGADPGTDDDSDQLQCRRNYTVLMTDGYWSGDATSGGPNNNNDGTDGPTQTGPTGASFSYKKVSPFTDGESSTLADVAMYYWKNDIRTDMANVVAVSKTSPAFWQHMTTFGVGLGVFGTIEPEKAFAAISSGDSISWPKPTSNEVHKIDDLLHAAVNSRGGFFSASEPEVFANKLGNILQTIANESKSSASSVAANSTRLDSGTLIYQASFNSLEWSGRIIAYSLNGDGSLNNVVWDTNKGGIPIEASRNIISAVGDQGATVNKAVAFTVGNWGELSNSQQDDLRAGETVDDGKKRLLWLRGDKSNEGSKFRERSTIMGDIINSDPFFVGKEENFGFSKLSGQEGSSYAAFLAKKATRTSMIYVGANDGMLHGFDAATGKEKFAYIPVAAFPKFAELSDSEYEHSYIVDGSPRVLDAYLSGSWKSILVGSLAAGGRSVFALNVTDPATLNASSFLWEFATASNAVDKLGVAMSQPIIARVAAGGKWVAIFGNGYNSGDNVKLFVVDLETGALIKAINTGVSGVDNGLASPVPVDVNNDRVTDFIYAGDLKGNLWKFDLTGASKNSWDVAYKNAGVAEPLYKVVDADGNTQAITSRPTVGVHPKGGYMVYFGTGKYFENSDGLLPVKPPIQDFYGIRDNGSSFTGRDKLLSQSIVFQGVATTADGSASANKIRIVTNNSVGTPPTYGWHLPLYPPSKVRTGERVVSQPILRNGRIIFASIVPSESVCGFGGDSWLMELDAVTGGRIGEPVLDINGDGKVNLLDLALFEGDYYPASGIGSEEMIKTPGIIGAGELEYKYTSGTSGTIGVITETGGGSDVTGRQSWRQLQ
ncbi:pilus assembly protein [Zhongshania sp. BJYM1]|uniref:pilus assembly protein n=1 Tax=Zhongshania aquatica TaxID=2965069 RepID=UPI0022B490C2|nr:PilC/PilY family type IV pilus protein [Marortus sp. BJYM1]